MRMWVSTTSCLCRRDSKTTSFCRLLSHETNNYIKLTHIIDRWVVEAPRNSKQKNKSPMSQSNPTASSPPQNRPNTRCSLTTIPHKHWSRQKTLIKTQRRDQPSQVLQALKDTKRRMSVVYSQDSQSRRRLSRRRCWMKKSSSCKSWTRSKV